MWIKTALVSFLWVTALVLITVDNVQGQANRLSQIDIARINVDDLSDQEVDQIAKAIKKEGLSMQDVEALAKAKGASTTQIAKLKSRLIQRRLDVPNNGDISSNTATVDVPFMEEFSRRQEPFEPSVKPASMVYGTSIFNNEYLTFQPSSSIPTPENYLLGTGDEIIIDIWGASKQTYQNFISRQGTITIGNLGPIYLNGLSVRSATAKVKKRLSEIYRGLSGDSPNTYFQLTMGNLRSINVVVLGEVSLPGTYTISSLATVFNALYLSGGPAKNGSLRNIEVLRNDKIVAKIDVYDFLLGGNQKQNIRLRDQDIVRVNAYKTRVKITGQVKRPMTYEMNEGESLSDLLRFASGFTEDAYTHRLNVRRKTSRGLKIRTLSLNELNTFQLKNGDVVEIDTILEKYSNRVTLRGAVYRPGDYELTEGLTIGQLIKEAEGLREYAYTSRALLYRTLEDYTTKIISFEVSDVMREEGKDIKLEKDDVIEIKSKPQMLDQFTVAVSGAVQSPGSFDYSQDMTLADVIIMANGFREGAYTQQIEIGRRVRNQSDNSGNISEIFLVDIDETLTVNSSTPSFKLEPYDEVFVRQDPGYKEQTSVYIEGEVNFPGTYVISSTQEYLSDIIERAGGLTEFAYLPGATQKRQHLSDSIFVGIDMAEILANPHSDKDLIMKPGDLISIPSKLQTVSIEGAVYNGIAVKFNKQAKFKDYIGYAGGYASKAKKGKTYIIYANGVSERIKRKFIFFKSYPKVKPGSTIIAPEKPPREGALATQEVIAFTTGIATIALLVQRIFQ